MESPNANAEMDFFFLNLDDCSREEKDLISNILRGENARPSFASQNTVPPPITSLPSKISEAPKFPEVPVSDPMLLDNFSQQQQQQQHHGMLANNGEMLPPAQQHQQQHQQQQQIQMYEYPMSSATMADYSSTLTTATAPPQTSYASYSATPSPSPYVFINNVHANVNVHHGPAAHMQDEQQMQQQQQQHQQHMQQQHQQHQQIMQQQRYQQQGQQQMHHQGPPPMAGHQGPPPPALLPTPQFGVSPGYIAPFGTPQQNMGMTKAGHQPAMFSMPPMYPYLPFPIPPYGYSPMGGPMMAPSMPQVPQQQALPRAPVSMIRAQAPMTAGTIYTPPPSMVSMTIPEVASFPGPPPVPVSVAPIMNGSQAELQQQSQPEVVRLVRQPQQHQEHVALQMEEKEDGQFIEFKPEVEDFGFEVPDEIEVEEDRSPVVVVVEKREEEDFDSRDDVPTPVQDEINADEDEQQQQQQLSPPKIESVTSHQQQEEERSPNQQQQEEARSPNQQQQEEARAPKSWASLFHSEAANSDGGRSNKPMALIHPYTGDSSDKSGGIGGPHSKGTFHGGLSVALGRRESEMASFLQGYVLNHKAQPLKPRGLSNRSNWCFVNAIMQALVACPPFYNMMKSLPEEIMHSESVHLLNSPLKILAAVNAFVSEFSALENFPRMNHRKEKNKKQEDLPLGKTFEAATIFQVLLNLNSDTFKVIEGRQEDAEEFLTFLLNGLNDEMLSVLKLLSNDSAEETEEDLKNVSGPASKIDSEEDDEWQEVGPKNKSCVTRRGGDLGTSCGLKTPLGDMFQGQIRSCVNRTAGETTATLQPFFTLQLDIQSEGIRNVSDALEHNFTVEALDGYVCSRTKQEIEASRSLLLEELPPILVLHLKRFVYNETSGGCQKLLKNIDFPVDLEIARDILSPNSRNKYAPRQRHYKLFAVVYHNGTEATKGHYVADVYHTGLSTWLHCDDSSLKPLSESMVMAHSASSMPYILFYRRGDTMGGGGGGSGVSEKVKLGNKTSVSQQAT